MKKIRKITMLSWLLVLGILLMAPLNQALAGTPHLVFGSITNTNASVPAPGDIQFSAYISTRTTDVLTQSSPGCSYDGTNYGVEVGNFAQPWSAGETLVITFLNLSRLEGKTVQVTLTNAGFDMSNVQLAALTPTTLTIAPVGPTVQVPNTQQFTATATFTGVTGDQNVTSKATWNSSDTDKGTINAAGLFTPNHVGTTNVTATLGGLTSNSSTVTVTAGPLATLTVSPDTATLTADQTQQFTATGVDAKGNSASVGTLTWSGGTGIGAINASSGLFTANTVGTGTVTATSSIGSVADSSGTITVTAGALATLTVSPNTVSLKAGQTQQFTVSGVDADGNAAGTGTITWSGGSGIGTINSSGLLSATTVGTATVTATSSLGKSGNSGTITVTPGDATKINVTATPSTITSSIAGALATIYATIVDAFNNIVTSFSNAVTFALDAVTFGDIKTGQTNPATPTSGVATIQIESKQTGGGDINVTASATGLTSGTVKVTTVPFGILSPVMPFNIRVGEKQTFTATGPGGFNWVFSGGSPLTANTTSIEWTAPATAQALTVTLTDPANTLFTTTQTINVYVLPDPVLTAVTTPTRNSKPTLGWGAVTNATLYDLQIASDANFQTIVETKTGIAATSFVPTNALADGTYYWQVRAIDAQNRTTPWVKGEAFTVDTTPPGPVTAFGVTPQATGDLKLDWTNPTTDFAGVIVVGATGAAPVLVPANGTAYTKDQQVGSDTVLYVGNLATFTDTVAHNTHRYYAVFAYDAVKNYSAAASADATSSDTTAPAAPTAPSAAAGNAQVTLSWTNPADPDFAGIVILMKQTSAPTGAPVNGTSYSAGGTVGDATVAYAAYANKAATATITGLTNNTRYYFAIYAVDERPNYSATAASANAIPGPPIIAAPSLPASVHVDGQLAFTATSGTGSYAWTVTGGTLSAATGASVTWTAPATVTTSPTAVTVRVTDPTTSLYAEGVVNVYSKVAVAKPATTPTVLAGTMSQSFTVAGGDGSYTWTVKDRAGNVIGTPQAGASFIFAAPATGAFAGEYTIEAEDGKGGKDSFKVNVPFTLTPSTKSFKRTSPQTFTIGGAAGSFAWELMSKSATDGKMTKIATPADYGTWTNGGATDPTNLFTPAAAITTAKIFYLQITVTGDADLTTVNGLDKQTFGPFQINPASEYTVNVKKADGTALNGAVVAVQGQLDAAAQPLKATVAAGKATFDLPDGAKYLYDVSLAGYVAQSVSSIEKIVNVTLQPSAAAITGTVEDNVGAALVGAKVVAYLPASPLTQYTADSVALGAFAINLPAGAASTGWTVVASKTGYAAVKLTGKDTTAAVAFTGAVNGLAAAGPATPAVSGGTGEQTATDLSGNSATVVVGAGGLGQDTAVIKITPAAKDPAKPSTFTEGSPDYVYEVKIRNAADTADLAAADIKRIVITLPIDLLVLKPGDLEKGVYSIYTAKTQLDMETGKGSAVPAANIIATDYVGNGKTGSVTFWIDHLSFFGIGLGGAADDSKSGCFIATAAYGSYFEQHVQILRNFRDVYLLTNDWGRAFVDFYYRHSPAVADVIAKNGGLRAAVRLGLAPVVGVAWVAIHTNPVEKALILLVLFGILAAGSVMILRARRVRRVIG